MATEFGLQEGEGTYPSSDTLFFGINESVHAKFVTPVAKFEFYDSKGASVDIPTIYIRMGGTFNTGLINSYTEERGIFGQPSADGSVADALKNIGAGMIDAVQTQILKSTLNAAGFLGSAGLSGRRNVEFIARKVVNEFQQLVYTGPSFRRFQLPFAMKPVSEKEAQRMIDIIQTFRIASSPIVKGKDNISVTGERTEEQNINPDTLGNSQDITRSPEELSSADQSANEDRTVTEETLATLSDVLFFEYPRFCKLSLLLYNNNGAGELKTLFQSDLCAIETVSVDYGAQNKMTFFKGTTDKYYPTDVTLTVALREAVLVTAEKASMDNGVIL